MMHRKYTTFTDKKLIVENGKKLTKAIFDDVDFENSYVIYKINGKCNIVTEDYVRTHKSKSDYKLSCIYNSYRTFKTFAVLSSKSVCCVDVISKDGTRLTLIGFQLLLSSDNFVILKSEHGYMAIYGSSNEAGYDRYVFEDLSENLDEYAFTTIQTSEFKHYSNKADLKQVLKFYKLLLNEEIKNFDKATLKHCANKSSDGSPVIQTKITTFKTVKEAEENAVEILTKIKSACLKHIQEMEEKAANAEFNRTHPEEFNKELEKASQALDAIINELN